MTGPSPDAELDAALGVDRLPPAAVTAEHRTRGKAVCRSLIDPAYPAPWQVDLVAQAIANAEQRGAARVLAEHAAAGIPVPQQSVIPNRDRG